MDCHKCVQTSRSLSQVRYTSDDPDFHCPAEDFKDFQERVRCYNPQQRGANNHFLILREIPENFCHKDKVTTEQAVFFCNVCNCDLKSLKPLRDHVTGSKHIRKALDFKRTIMGIPNQVKQAQINGGRTSLILRTAAPERAQGEEHQEVETKSGHWTESS